MDGWMAGMKVRLEEIHDTSCICACLHCLHIVRIGCLYRKVKQNKRMASFESFFLKFLQKPPTSAQHSAPSDSKNVKPVENQPKTTSLMTKNAKRLWTQKLCFGVNKTHQNPLQPNQTKPKPTDPSLQSASNGSLRRWPESTSIREEIQLPIFERVKGDKMASVFEAKTFRFMIQEFEHLAREAESRALSGCWVPRPNLRLCKQILDPFFGLSNTKSRVKINDSPAFKSPFSASLFSVIINII